MTLSKLILYSKKDMRWDILWVSCWYLQVLCRNVCTHSPWSWAVGQTMSSSECCYFLVRHLWELQNHCYCLMLRVEEMTTFALQHWRKFILICCCFKGVHKGRRLHSQFTPCSVYFPCYFQVKAMKFHINLAFNHSVYVDNVDTRKMYLNDFFFGQMTSWKVNLETPNLLWFFSRFSVKVSGFYHFLSKLQSFSWSLTVNDKIAGFQCFPGTACITLSTYVGDTYD